MNSNPAISKSDPPGDCAAHKATLPSGAAPLAVAPAHSLLPILFICVALGISTEEATALVETGEIAPAFDISREHACRRREIRVDRRCLETQNRQQWKSGASVDDSIARLFPKALSLVPAEKATVRLPDLAARLTCSHEQVRLLIQDGQFSLARPPRYRSEPATIKFSSILAFLKRRLIQ